MADTDLNTGSGPIQARTLERSANVKTQVVAFDIGGAGGPEKLVDESNPMPVSGLFSASGTHFQPGYDLAGGIAAEGPLLRDPDGNLVTRSQVLTDEGSYRVNFANSSLSVSIGTATFTAGSSAVTGTGFLASDVRTGDYVKLNADAESAWIQVDSLNSDTSITLVSAYTGTGGTGASSRAIIKPATGSGGSIAVASGVCTITSGTTNNAITEIERDVDWLPLVKQCGVTLSQRIANQSTFIGFYDETAPAAPKWFAWFVFDGTTNTTAKVQSARNPTTAPAAAEIEETSFTLPNGATTATAQRYRVEILGDRVYFYVNSILVATHFKSMPGPGDLLTSTIRVANGTGAASTTTVTVDYDSCQNHNKLQIGLMSDAEQVVAVAAPLQPANYNVAGVIAINTDILLISCSQLRSICLQATSIGTTGRLDFFLTNDLSVVGTAQPAYPIGGGAGVTTTTAAGMWMIPTNGAAFLRVRMGVATTAGTTTVFAQGSQAPVAIPAPTTQPVSLATNTPALAAGTNLAGDFGIQYRANATGAATTSKFASAASVNNALILTGARRLLGWSLTNTTASFKYFRFYNKATAPTSGESPTFMVGIPPNSTVISPPIVGGIAMSLGLGIACTGAVADTDATVTVANDVIGEIFYV